MRRATSGQVRYASDLASRLGAGAFWLEDFAGCPRGGDVKLYLDFSEAARVINSLKRGEVPRAD